MIKIANLSDIPPGEANWCFLTKHLLHYLISMVVYMPGIIDALIEEHRYRMVIFLKKLFSVNIICGNFSIRKKCAVENDQIKITSFRVEVVNDGVFIEI